jgi:hypothetical protein
MAKVDTMTEKEVMNEIMRVQLAISKTSSQPLKRDYYKYLNKLRRRLLAFES